MATGNLPQICMEPKTAMPAETPLGKLEVLVQVVEAARLQSRALTAEEDSKLDGACDARAPLAAIAAMQASDADRLELRGLGHRLWAALGHATAEKHQDAKCRSLACELYAAGFKERSPNSQERLLLATHWALAGRAWIFASGDQKALSCFAEVLKPYRADPEGCDAKLAELSAQTLVGVSKTQGPQYRPRIEGQ